jgi:hypothetical protein
VADDELLAGLRTAATALDDAAPPIGAADLRTPARGPDRLPVVALAVAFVALVAVVALLLARGSDDEDGRVVTPGPVPTTPELPDVGFALRSADDPVTLYDLDGDELATAALSDLYNDGPAYAVSGVGDDLRIDVPVAASVEPPAGCLSPSAGGGVVVALCQVSDRFWRIELVGPDGTRTPLADPPTDPGAPVIEGHWQWVVVSPDGRWVLGQWASECGSAHGFVLATDGTTGLHAVTGESGADGAWLTAPRSRALGWAPDGRAIIELSSEDCGGPLSDAGVYLLDPATGERQRIHAIGPGESAYAWTRAAALDQPIPGP